jgi:hypothetical protein
MCCSQRQYYEPKLFCALRQSLHRLLEQYQMQTTPSVSSVLSTCRSYFCFLYCFVESESSTSQSYDWRSVNQSWCRVPFGSDDQILVSRLKFTLSDERPSLSFVGKSYSLPLFKFFFSIFIYVEENIEEHLHHISCKPHIYTQGMRVC